MVGFAATGRIRTADAPIARSLYYERMDFWEFVERSPKPIVIVLEDLDPQPGRGAFFGEVHAHIGRAMGAIGYVTNGSVRDLPGIARTGFHLFAGGISPSHAYAHVVDFGGPVVVGGLTVRPGDLLHGDLHGVVSIPEGTAGRIPGLAADLLAREGEIIRVCQPGAFSMKDLRSMIERNGHASR
jgi:regulator of RNase E activity RraA